MLVVGIILAVVCLTGLFIFAYNADDENEVAIGAVLMLFLILGFICIIVGATENDPVKKSLSEYDVKISIKVEYEGTKEVGRDTIYVFTPKKK